ncbi:MAG: ABC transporter permease, partial [Candidatus Bipolaricaulota bacterium]|nr:ABC transporter permease [Candidatus Bipolaricaulota bacterium]MCS7273881.1 ABC transporter permease [Candidatus Bipolaricaulota bacterium]MDW8110701.1 ABC transporter permease [Candidatus Bipolaricaulota bacterium]MDW8328441.1 ABC transporter permease [Candidatus Bipolaricaulota bacterium]
MMQNFWRDLNIFLRTVRGRSYPRLIGMQREKSWIFFDTFLPLLATTAYVFIYRALNAPPEFTGFVVLGGAMTAYWFNVLWSMATQLYWEKETGNLALYLIAPTSRMAILLGMAVGGMAATTLRAVTVLLVGSLLFGVTFSVENWGALLVVFVLTLVALYGLGMVFASLFLLWGREAWHLAALFQEPIFLVSGFYFPVRNLGFWVSLGASIIPITLGLDAMRQLLYPQAQWGFLDVNIEITALAVLSVLFLILSHRMLLFMENLARREGRLTVRGQ